MRELENPLKMLDQAVLDMQADMVKMRQAAAQVSGHSRLVLQSYLVVAPPGSCAACSHWLPTPSLAPGHPTWRCCRVVSMRNSPSTGPFAGIS